MKAEHGIIREGTGRRWEVGALARGWDTEGVEVVDGYHWT